MVLDDTKAHSDNAQEHEQLISNLGYLIARYWLNHHAIQDPTDQSEQEENTSLSDECHDG